MGKSHFPTPPGWPAPAGRGGSTSWAPAVLVVCLALFPAAASAQTPASLKLAHSFIEPTSLRVLVDGMVWQPGVDYRLRAREGLWLPLQPVGSQGGEDVLVILSYRFRPAPLAPRVDLHEVADPPELAQGPATGPAAAAAASLEPMGDLTVRGSKSVRVASGSQRELSVDQNLRLSISGQLTSDIAVKASLSDDNLPVVPEGNTEELRDVDKVLVELTASHWQATLGDFVAQRRRTVFGSYRRKLQGASLTAQPGALEAELLAGEPRGVYRTFQILGVAGNQGP